MKSLSKYFLFIFLLLVWRDCHSALVSWKDVSDSLVKTHPDISQFMSLLNSARQDYRSSLGFLDPSLSLSHEEKSPAQYESYSSKFSVDQNLYFLGSKLSAGWQKSEGKFGPYDLFKETGTGGRYFANLKFNILRGSFVDEYRAKILERRRSITLAEAQLQSRSLQVFREAAEAFVDLIKNREKLLIYQELVELAKNRDEFFKKRLRVGDFSKIDYMDNQRQIYQRLAQEEIARSEFYKAAIKFSLYFRDEKGNPIVLGVESIPKIEAIDFKTNQILPLSEVIENHPDILGMKSDISIKEIKAEAANNQILPDLSIEGNYQQDQGELPVWRNRRDDASILAKLTIPLGNRSANGNFRSLQGQLEASRQKLKYAREKQQADILRSKMEAEAISRVAINALEELKMSKNVEHGEFRLFKGGEGSLFRLNIREQDRLSAQIKHIDAQIESQKKWIEYRALVNK